MRRPAVSSDTNDRIAVSANLNDDFDRKLWREAWPERLENIGGGCAGGPASGAVDALAAENP